MAVSRKSNLNEHLIHEIAKLYLDSEYYGEVMCSTGHTIPEGNNVDEFLMFGLRDAKLKQQYLDTKIVEPGNEELYKLFLLDIILTARTIKWIRALADSLKKEEQAKSADKKEEQVKSAEIKSAAPPTPPIPEQKTKISDKPVTTTFFGSPSDHQPMKKSTLSRDQISRIENVIKLLEGLFDKSREDAGIVTDSLGGQIEALQLILDENKKGKSSFEIFLTIENIKKNPEIYIEGKGNVCINIQHAAVIEILTNLSSELQSRADWSQSREKSYIDSLTKSSKRTFSQFKEDLSRNSKLYTEPTSFISCALGKTS